jgi:hypothetical protein
MTPEQRDSLCEYVDGQREAGRRYDEIAETLEGKLPDADLERLEEWHRQWKRQEWRKELNRLREAVSIEDTDLPEGDTSGEELSLNESGRERQMVRYLAERLIGREVVKDGAKIRWKQIYQRTLLDGQICECVKGPGQAGGVRWMYSAVIFKTGARIDHVEAEARIRHRVWPDSPRSLKNRQKREAVVVEKLHLVREGLDLPEIGARLAALLQTYLGKCSGIKSGAHLARLTNRTRQAVSARKLLIAEDYYAKTGGKAGFEGLTSAARHREKVAAKTQNHDPSLP